MRSFQPTYLDSLRFTPEEAATLGRLGEHKGQQLRYSQAAPEVLETLRRRAVIESNTSSNRLEGVVAEAPRIEKLVSRTTPPRNRSEGEIAGYRDALALIHESGEHMPFSCNMVLQLHSLLYRYMPQEGGRFKMADNEIVERDAAGEVVRVRFRAVPAVTTPATLEQLTDLYGTARETLAMDPLVLVPLAILDFLCIHPFSDGNGRLARLLTLQFLYRHGYLIGRYVSLERIVEESKETYYETLEASSQGWHEGTHDSGPWRRYFWGVLLKAYSELEDRLQDVSRPSGGRGAKSRLVRNLALEYRRPFSFSELTQACPGISSGLVRRVLRQLKAEGRIQVAGRGRGARWTPV